MVHLEEKKRGEKQRASWETAEHSFHQETSGGLWLEGLTRLLFRPGVGLGWLLGSRTIQCIPSNVWRMGMVGNQRSAGWLSQPCVKSCVDSAGSAELWCAVQAGRAGERSNEGQRHMSASPSSRSPGGLAGQPEFPGIWF